MPTDEPITDKQRATFRCFNKRERAAIVRAARTGKPIKSVTCRLARVGWWNANMSGPDATREDDADVITYRTRDEHTSWTRAQILALAAEIEALLLMANAPRDSPWSLTGRVWNAVLDTRVHGTPRQLLYDTEILHLESRDRVVHGRITYTDRPDAHERRWSYDAIDTEAVVRSSPLLYADVAELDAIVFDQALRTAKAPGTIIVSPHAQTWHGAGFVFVRRSAPDGSRFTLHRALATFLFEREQKLTDRAFLRDERSFARAQAPEATAAIDAPAKPATTTRATIEVTLAHLQCDQLAFFHRAIDGTTTLSGIPGEAGLRVHGRIVSVEPLAWGPSVLIGTYEGAEVWRTGECTLEQVCAEMARREAQSGTIAAFDFALRRYPVSSPETPTLRDDAESAAWRTAAAQFSRLAREPLVATLARHLAPGDASLRARLAAFLETDVGGALLDALLGVGLGMLPEAFGRVPTRLARELRVRAMATVEDLVADALLGPLRAVVATWLRGVAPDVPVPPGLDDGARVSLRGARERIHAEEAPCAR